MKLCPKNWAQFQHYKDRSPPWIKLHKALLDDRAFQRLPDASRALAPCLWLIASEGEGGVFDGSVEEIVFRVRQSDAWVAAALKPLIDNGFFIVVEPAEQVASTALAESKQSAMPEKSREEAEKEEEGEEKPRKRGARQCPKNFKVTEDMAAWAAKKTPAVDVAAETEKFRDHTFSRPISDWPGAWRNWMRKAAEFNKGKPAPSQPPAVDLEAEARRKADEEWRKRTPEQIEAARRAKEMALGALRSVA